MQYLQRVFELVGRLVDLPPVPEHATEAQEAVDVVRAGLEDVLVVPLRLVVLAQGLVHAAEIVPEGENAIKVLNVCDKMIFT